MVFKLDGDDSRGAGRFGFALRPQTDGAHLFVGYDLNGIWKIGEQTFNGPTLVKGQDYKLQVRFVGKQIDVYLDGEEIHSGVVDIDMPTQSSYGIGFRTWYGVNDSYVDHFTIGDVGTVIGKEAKEIASVEAISVETYPRVRPELPTYAKITYVDGTNGQEEVSWPHIEKESYSKVGTFTVEGTLLNRENAVTATVNVVEAPDGEIVPPDVTVEEKVLTNGDLSVYIDNNFPRAIRYEVGEEVLQGEEEQLYIVELNGDKYAPTVSYEEVNATTGRYTMTFENIDVVMTMEMKLVDANTLRMEVTNIEESGSFKVQTINIPDHNLATVKSTDNGKISSVITTGDWNNIRERFEDVSDVKVGNYKKTYGIINDDNFAITIDNNVIEGGDRLSVNVSNRDGYKLAGLSNGTWTYREPLTSSKNMIFTGKIGDVEVISKNQVIMNSEEDIKEFMGKEYEAVYCGLGAEEDYQGKDLTGKVALVDRGTYALVDKAKNAMNAGAEYLIMINNTDGLIPEQGYQAGVNVIGIEQKLGDEIKAQLSEDNTINVFFDAEKESSESVPGDPEELPWSQISITKDTNKNGKVDWQDAAILYRENMEAVVGAENIPNTFSYIPFNIGSLAQAPFLRSADMVKKLSNYTDGFGQLVLHKGYQAEGHDDAIADIGGHTGIRQGGKDDLNKLIEIGKDYNAKIGVHVNATEYHLDAFELAVENLKPGFQGGWSWKDNSYYVDQRKDITSGELERRFDMLKADHPDLGWIYVDVYTGNGWNANELAEIINNNGWMLATEFNDGLESRREDGNINMYKDGRLVATTDHSTINDRGIGKTKLFLHWTWDQLGETPENKVYHWNPYGGESTWDLPTEWAGTETIKLYELSDLGKTFVEEIEVVNGKVTKA